MKFVFYGFMVVVAYVLGKVMYAPLAPSLLGNSSAEVEQSETVQEIKVQSPAGTVIETVDLAKIDAKDYPEKVMLASELVLTDKNGLSPLKLEPGSPVKPLVLSDMMLEVTSPLATHLTGKIPVLETDFAKEVAKKRMDRRMALMAAQGGGGGTPAPQPQEPKPAPQEVAVVEEPAPAPMEVPEPMPEPEPEPEPAAPTSMSADQLVAAMKASLEGGSIQELDPNKVFKWEAGEDESFDGETFQVGIATYKEMTILGEKTLQAKALFKEGELDKWIHAKTGMEIR